MPKSPNQQPVQSSADVKEQSQGQQEEYELPSGIDLSNRQEATKEQVKRDLEAVSEKIGNRMDKNSADSYLTSKFNKSQKLNRRNAADAVCMQTIINTLLPQKDHIQVDGRYFGQSIAACKTIQAILWDEIMSGNRPKGSADPNFVKDGPKVRFTGPGRQPKVYTKNQFCDGIFGNDTFEAYAVFHVSIPTSLGVTETETETTVKPQASPNAFPAEKDQSTTETETETTDEPQTPEQKRDAVTRTVFHLHQNMGLMEQQAVTSYSEEELEKRTDFISKIKTAIASYKATPAPLDEDAKTKWSETGRKVEELEGSILVIENNIEASNIYQNFV